MRVIQENLITTIDSDLITDFPRSFSIDLRVSKSDVDGLGHMNNAVYVNWLDQAHLYHLFNLGITMDVMKTCQRGLVVRHSEVDYLSALQENDLVRVGTCVASCDGKLRLCRHFQMVRRNDGVTVLRGLIDYVCIDYKNGKPRRMPAEFVNALVPAVL
ncbi:acyl-CoA thioesterase [bacterium]|nr:acyl-CoA thioesterase [bacterium]